MPATPSQGIIALACGHNRTLPIADATAAAELGGLIACPECERQSGYMLVRVRILKGAMIPAPDWQGFYADKCRAALAEYDQRKHSYKGDAALFYAEMAGLLSESMRALLEEMTP